MDLEFLQEEKWPKLGNTAGEPAKKLHEWCGKIFHLLLSLADRVKQLEAKDKENLLEIVTLKHDLESTKKEAAKLNVNTQSWVDVVTRGTKNAKNPVEQLMMANTTISELQEREKRKKNIIIYGVPESSAPNPTDKRTEDEAKTKKIMKVVDKVNIKAAYSKRLRSKDTTKPSPLLVDLTDASLRNPVLLAAKKFRDVEGFKSVYISPDLTEAERQLDYKLRQHRNSLNAELGADSPFRYSTFSNRHKTLHCMYFNATSLDNKMDKFRVVIETHHPSIIGVSETWFKDSPIVNINNFKVYRKDRNDGRCGGGMCLFINSPFNSYEVTDGVFSRSNVEQVWAVIYFENGKYLIGCIYRPDYFVDMDDLELVLKQAKSYVNGKGFKDVLKMGDFNFPFIGWSNGSIVSIKNVSGIEHKFSDIISETFFYQHVDVPTFQKSSGVTENILDLIFTKESGNICSVDPIFVLGNISQGHLI
ncbi:hypothetical protein HELRODRAFT_164888 [Helobdella robusta]|uniref:Endonuclease/exonuclease/phosphatase domain-containing protein n=1 Tax=Helobdella robusta TaxID=6412 RepID=T1EVX2_HELRO|nr:hypothetical protein HELRODRAFT_164888 [Helobdella robusta]ESN92775.1 hypothetical protein HELRODRAFT_164888 [Helobdella robusta]